MHKTFAFPIILGAFFCDQAVSQETSKTFPAPPETVQLVFSKDDLKHIVDELSGVKKALEALQVRTDEVAADAERNRDLRDLKAQEEMAKWAKWMFWATFMGLVLGFFSLVAIIFTLRYTRQAAHTGDGMASDARAIGRAQVRAYLHCQSAKYFLKKDTLGAAIELRNAGQSPASEIKVTGTVTVHDVGGLVDRPRVLAWLASNVTEGHCQPIAAQGQGGAEIVFFWEYSFPEDEHFDRQFQRTIFETGNEVWFDLEVSWKDVFENKHTLALNLSAAIDASPSSPKKKRTATGDLHIIVDENALTSFRNK